MGEGEESACAWVAQEAGKEEIKNMQLDCELERKGGVRQSVHACRQFAIILQPVYSSSLYYRPVYAYIVGRSSQSLPKFLTGIDAKIFDLGIGLPQGQACARSTMLYIILCCKEQTTPNKPCTSNEPTTCCQADYATSVMSSLHHMS